MQQLSKTWPGRKISFAFRAKIAIQAASVPSCEGAHGKTLEGVITIIEVSVRENNVEQALRVLKKKMQREGIYREMKLRKHYEKPSLRKTREKEESVRRARKMQRKKRERDGY